MVVVSVVPGAGWQWWQEKCMHGIVWSCTAQFGGYVPDGHKGPLNPMAINAIVA